ncbi:MAG TPA: hypothetical protein VLA56_19735 [Pseudomonadales bacterium]|nr:hypothetical protein [Pseudomonadales bacterium]
MTANNATKTLRTLAAPPHRWEEMLASPAWFLHHVDLDGGRFGFLRTSRDSLSKASFVDGRSPLGADGCLHLLPAQAALDWFRRAPRPAGERRFLFHVSFCGSTLLARILDVPGRTFAYKEPQALVELADHARGRQPRWVREHERIVDFVTDQYLMPWPGEAATLVKPSNWANNLLPELIGGGGNTRALFLTLTPEAFLTAVFRGGSPRIEYIRRLLAHLTAASPTWVRRVEALAADSADELERLARLVLVVHAIQARTFAAATDLLDATRQLTIGFDALIAEPAAAAQRAAQVLDLPLTAADIDASVLRHLPNHSKVTERGFDVATFDGVAGQVMDHYGAPFAAALDWYERQDGFEGA